MKSFDELAAHWREQRQQTKATLRDLQAGLMQFKVKGPDGERDGTPEWITELEHQIARLDAVISAYERGEAPPAAELFGLG